MFLLTRRTDFVGNETGEKKKTKINYRLIYFHLPTPLPRPRGFISVTPIPPCPLATAAVDSAYNMKYTTVES